MIAIRPANMRTVHGIRFKGDSGFPTRGYSVSAVQCVEDEHSDHMGVAVSGGGMDAPEDLPVGSVKAFFRRNIGDGLDVIGFCQRTTQR